MPAGNPQLTSGPAVDAYQRTPDGRAVKTYDGTYTVANGVIVSANMTQAS